MITPSSVTEPTKEGLFKYTLSFQYTTTPSSVINQCRKTRTPLCALCLEHHTIKAVHLSYSNITGSLFLNESNAKLLACAQLDCWFFPLLSFWMVTASQPSLLSPLFSRHMRDQTWFNHTTHGFCWSFSHACPQPGSTSLNSSGFLWLCIPSETSSRHLLLQQTLFFSPVTLYQMCVCVCVNVTYSYTCFSNVVIIWITIFFSVHMCILLWLYYWVVWAAA